MQCSLCPADAEVLLCFSTRAELLPGASFDGAEKLRGLEKDVKAAYCGACLKRAVEGFGAVGEAMETTELGRSLAAGIAEAGR